MPAPARLRRFFRVPRDRPIRPAAIIRLELFLIALPATCLAIAHGDGLAAPVWLLAVTSACCYATGLAGAVLLAGRHRARLANGRHGPATATQLGRSNKLAMLGAGIGALASVWFAVRGEPGGPLVPALVSFVAFAFAGLVRGVMIVDLPVPSTQP